MHVSNCMYKKCAGRLSQKRVISKRISTTIMIPGGGPVPCDVRWRVAWRSQREAQTNASTGKDSFSLSTPGHTQTRRQRLNKTTRSTTPNREIRGAGELRALSASVQDGFIAMVIWIPVPKEGATVEGVVGREVGRQKEMCS